ncbi:MAG: hypothetical protein HYR97_03680, partial [Candidatus Melainabacteria bacterium]|nr:hypothetical protein [Candidatus Melainabacteria bacterium]
MQTRRVFLCNVLDFATVALSGTLVTIGKDQINRAAREEESKQSENPVVVPIKHTDKVGLPAITVNHATDFALGGALGLMIKKVIEKSTKLSKVNRELSFVIGKLQKLENDD